MSWLRVDDGFTSNAKVAQLTDSEFRVWMRLLCHCARSQDPSVDPVARREVNGLTAGRVRRYADLGLLDAVGDHHEVHDWSDYQPKDSTAAERQARWRSRQAVTGAVTPAVTEPLPRVRAGARDRPVPPSPEAKSTADGPTAAAVERLKKAGWSDGQVSAAVLEFGRAIAWLDHAEADPSCQSVGALSWSMFKKGGSPETAATVANGAQGTRSTSKPVTYTCPECEDVFDTYQAREDHVDATHRVPAPPPQKVSA